MDRSEGSQIGNRPLLSYGYFPSGLASEIKVSSSLVSS